MDVNDVANAVGSVGFPIVACLVLFYFNKVEIENLRDTINKNTEVLAQLKDIIRMIDRRGKGGNDAN